MERILRHAPDGQAPSIILFGFMVMPSSRWFVNQARAEWRSRAGRFRPAMQRRVRLTMTFVTLDPTEASAEPPSGGGEAVVRADIGKDYLSEMQPSCAPQSAWAHWQFQISGRLQTPRTAP